MLNENYYNYIAFSQHSNQFQFFPFFLIIRLLKKNEMRQRILYVQIILMDVMSSKHDVLLHSHFLLSFTEEDPIIRKLIHHILYLKHQ